MLAASHHSLVGVLTRPDRPAGRGRQLKRSPVGQLAEELGLPLAQPERLDGIEQRAPLVRWACDLLVVVAYGLLLPESVLTLPRLGCINIHASLLPRWRGAAPIQRAILAGDRETGVTIMQLERGLDTGPVLSQQRTLIGEHTDAGQLQSLLADLGAQLLLTTLDALEAGRIRAEPQALEGVTYASKIDTSEARIDWRRSAEEISRQVRAFNPSPVASTLWRQQRLRIFEARVAAALPGTPGEVLGVAGDAIEVRCGQGALAVTTLQLEGRRMLSAGEFARGQALAGEHFA